MITGENIAHSRVLRVPVYRSQIYCRRREVEKELTGKDTEPSEIIYFKLYKSQIPVVERATEIAG